MAITMYHNGENFCYIHSRDHDNGGLLIYGSKRPYDDENTKYKTLYSAYAIQCFLKENGYKKI